MPRQNANSEIARLQDENFYLKAELDVYDANLKWYSKKCGHLGNEIGDLRNELVEMEEEHEEALGLWRSKCGKLGFQVRELKKQLTSMESDHNAAQKSSKKVCEQLKNETGQLQNKWLKKEADHEAALKAWKNKCKQLADENNRLQAKLTLIESDHESSRRLWDEMCGELKNKLLAVETEHYEALHSWKTKCEQLVDESDQLRDQLLAKEVECNAKNHTIMELLNEKEIEHRIELEEQRDEIFQRKDLKEPERISEKIDYIQQKDENVHVPKVITGNGMTDSTRNTDSPVVIQKPNQLSPIIESEDEEAGGASNTFFKASSFDDLTECIQVEHIFIGDMHHDETAEMMSNVDFWMKKRVSATHKHGKISSVADKVSGADQE